MLQSLKNRLQWANRACENLYLRLKASVGFVFILEVSQHKIIFCYAQGHNNTAEFAVVLQHRDLGITSYIRFARCRITPLVLFILLCLLFFGSPHGAFRHAVELHLRWSRKVVGSNLQATPTNTHLPREFRVVYCFA